MPTNSTLPRIRQRPSARKAMTATLVLISSGLGVALSGAQPAADAPREAPRVSPERGPQTPIEARQPLDPLRPHPGSLLPEGAYLRNRRGRMVAGESGAWIFLFDVDAAGESEPPMILQPCIRLMEMRRLAEGKEQTITFSVTGQVYVYNRRDYLLPTAFTTVSADSLRTNTDTVSETVAETHTDPAAAQPSANPQASDLLKAMDDAGEGRPAARAVAKAPLDSRAQAVSLLREGFTIVKRRGRVERGGGSPVFVSDNGISTKSDQDGPLRLAPCMILEELERIVRERGEQQIFLISGQVFVYEDRNYLIPTVFRVEPDREGNLVPAQ